MALLYLEGFEGYATVTDMTTGNAGPCRWLISTHFGGATSYNTTTFRTTQVTAGNSRAYQVPVRYYGYDLIEVPSSTELIMGFGYYRVPSDNVNVSICGFGGTTCDSQGIVLAHSHTTGTLYAATAGGNGVPATTLGTASITLSLSTWYYIEVRAKLSSTVGEFEVYVDGVQVLNLTNINSATGGIASYQVAAIAMHNTGSGSWSHQIYDDLYILDKTGATNNTFLGPISVYSLMPTGAGSVTELTPTGAASNWDAVNDATNDNATTYVATGTTGNKDYYTFEQLPGSVTAVPGVMMRTCGTLAASGTRKLQMNLKYVASVVSSSLKTLTLGSWKQNMFVRDTAPDGAAWTPAKVNALEGGVEAG
ncbi:MAG: hypothetical protein AAB250_13795 [Bdellovibrionota bacterium]